MLHFIYTKEHPQTQAVREAQDLLVDARLYALGDKYGVNSMNKAIIISFRSLLEKYWNTSEFAQAAAIVHSTTPETNRGLRDEIKRVTWSYQKTLLKREDLQTVIQELQGYSSDIAQAAIEAAKSDLPGAKPSNRILMHCNSCDSNKEVLFLCPDQTYRAAHGAPVPPR